MLGKQYGIEFGYGACSKQTPPLCVTEEPNCQSSFGRPGFYQINHEGKDLRKSAHTVHLLSSLAHTQQGYLNGLVQP